MNLHAYPAWRFVLPRECMAEARGTAVRRIRPCEHTGSRSDSRRLIYLVERRGVYGRS